MSSSVNSPSAVIVLAAGEGTRMKSTTPKVLHTIGGRSLVGHALASAGALEPDALIAVVRHERDRVAAHIQQVAPKALLADQDDIKGTGRAVACALEAYPQTSGTVVVTSGDVPLLSADTLRDVVRRHHEARAAVSILAAEVPDATGYGRIVRDAAGVVTGIVEHKDATDAQREIREINSGIYAFDAKVLTDGLATLNTDNAQGEMYLTDVIAYAAGQGLRVIAVPTTDLWQLEGVNDRVQLATLGAELNQRVLRDWMRAGVTVVDPASTWVDVTVELAQDVTLLPGTLLHGGTSVQTGAVIGPETTLTDCVIEADAEVIRTHGSGATVRTGASVGPFSFLRPGTDLGAKGKIGAFVETKNAKIGDGSKVPHLSYVGDATIGVGSNIGAATVFVNYDGVNKHRTTIGDHARVGSDSMLVAPVTIGDGAYTAAGSVITNDVPPGAIGVARAKQRNVEGWVARSRAGSASAQAAHEALAKDGQDAS